jgi:2-aminoadipate transaminase
VAGAAEPPISQLMHRALAHPDLISLAAGFVDQQSLPVAEVAAAAARVASDEAVAQAALQYGSTAGFAPLRRQILDALDTADAAAQRVADKSGSSARPVVDVDAVVLTAGSNQLLHLVTECVCEPGDIVLCAAPTYFVYLGLLAGLGIRAVGIDADEHGIQPAALAAQLARHRAAGEANRVKAVYVVSYFDNPSGATLSLARRRELLQTTADWAQTTGNRLLVLEDAAYRELRYAGDDLPSLFALDGEGETVVYAGTFSKSFAPGLRIGWGVVPRSLTGALLYWKGNIDFGSAHYNQVLMSKLIDAGDYRRQADALRATYRAKMQAMIAACERHFASIAGVDWRQAGGGLYVWLSLPETVDAGPRGALFDRAIAEGMLYVPGEFCYPAEGSPLRKNTMRLSFGVQSPERIDRGIAALARAIRATLAS